MTEMSPAVYRTRLNREKQARKAAERIIEKKSEELFRSTRELENILSGTVKMLTDVLALALPDIFQKATKVQRWARKVAPKLEIERPWELDLAATLYPLGIIGLRDELVLKYAQGKPLSEAEKKQIGEGTRTAYELVHNIPRMEGVAQAILYCAKGFDGSGYPADGLAGMGIPQNARVLKVLIDLADASTGEKVSCADGFVALASRKQEYDLEILKVAYIELLEKAEPARAEKPGMELCASALRAGDVVLRDIVDADKRLLLSCGSSLSELNIRRLVVLANQGQITGKIQIERPQG